MPYGTAIAQAPAHAAPGATRLHSGAGFGGTQELSASSAQFNAPSGTNGFTALWVKFDTIPNLQTVKLFEVGTGIANTPATEMLIIQLQGSNGFFQMANSDGTSYGVLNSNIAPTAGLWYHLQAVWGGTLAFTVYDHTGAVINSFSASAALNPYNPLVNPTLWLGGGGGLAFPFTGTLDSVAHWRSGNIGATAGIGAYLANSGKALDFNDLNTGAFAATVANLSAWYNLDEPAGASSWLDSGPHGVHLTATGRVMQQAGAGF